MARANPVQFVQQVRAEVGKVVWPTRRETALTTLMVFLLAGLMAVFFFFVDFGIQSALEWVLFLFGS